MDKKERIDGLYMKMAFIWAQNSYAIRRKVGCLIVKNNRIISDGYNGTPCGFENVCEEIPEEVEKKLDHWVHNLSDNSIRFYLQQYQDNGGILKTKTYVLHAESNAITKLVQSNNDSNGATLYVTDEPCIDCAKLIIQAGIKRVVFCREYRSHDGIKLLKKAGIEVCNIYFTEETIKKLQEV